MLYFFLLSTLIILFRFIFSRFIKILQVNNYIYDIKYKICTIQHQHNIKHSYTSLLKGIYQNLPTYLKSHDQL